MENIKTNPEAIYFIPTLDYVNDLQVGMLALNCFGRFAEVVSITFRGIDVNGKAYVGYYTESGKGSSMSMSIKEGELVRTVHLSNLHKSAELDTIERQMLAAK